MRSMAVRTWLLLFALAVSAAAQWKVGLGRADITPDEPVLMGGYGARKEPSAGVDGRIWVKAAAFDDGQGKIAVLVTADILGFTREHAAEISARLKASRNLERGDLLLNASHSHAGPLVDLTRFHEFSADAELEGRTERYVAGLLDAVVESAETALDSREPARLAWGWGAVDFPYNRREPTPDGIVIGVNPRGPVDRTVPLLRVSGEGGRIRAVLFGAATHPAALRGDNLRISGDYAGFAQERVERELGGAQAMFLLGCAGDSVPHPRGSLSLARRHGEELAEEVLRLAELELTPVDGALRTRFRVVDLPLQQLSREDIERESKTRYHAYYGERALALLDAGKPLPTVLPAPLALWRFGSGLTLVSFSGETVVDYALAAERVLGPLDLWLSGYNNEVFGYLASERLLREGGYETRGVVGTRPGLFAPETEAVVMLAIREMAKSAGRDVPQR